MNLKTKVVTGLGWIAGANFLGQMITWAITIVVMRILSPADYGLLAMSSVFVAFLTMMASAGLGPAIVQASEISDVKLRKLFGLIIALNLSLFFLLFSTAPLIANFFDESRLVNIVRVLSLQFVILSFAVIPESLLGRELNFKMRAMVDLFSNVTGGLLTLMLALAGYGVWSLVAGTMLSVVVRTIGVNVFAPYIRWPDWSLRGTGALIAFGGNVTASRILWFFYSQADMFIAGKLLGKEALGFYSVAMHLASLPVQKISGILNQVAFPAFSQIKDDPNLVATHVLKAVRILSFFSFPVLWGVSSVAPELVRLLLGANWEPAILPLQVLPAIMPLRMISNFLPSAVDSVGRPDISMKNLVVASIVLPVAFFVGSHWGVQGLCFAWLIGFPLVFISNLVRVLPALSLRLNQLIGAMAPPAFASAVMYGSIVGIRHAIATETGIAWRLGILVFVGIVIYGIGAIITNRRVCFEVLGVIKR